MRYFLASSVARFYIKKKHLIMLIPFLPIRFRKYLQGKSVSDVARKELTEFIRECIMIIEREKTNGTLTELASEDVVELLSVTCGYLFKNEPELYKEVHEIMNPTIKLQREIAAEFAEEAARAREEAAKAAEKAESSIRNFIQIGQKDGRSFQEISAGIREVFSLSETETEEKMKEYWKN